LRGLAVEVHELELAVFNLLCQRSDTALRNLLLLMLLPQPVELALESSDIDSDRAPRQST
jgi:hypothetical protein